jgi:hypothetical protein
MAESEASEAGRALVARRYAKMTPQERSRAASRAASAPWENMTLEERKAEVKRRMAGKGKKKAKKARKRKAPARRKRAKKAA